MSDSFTPLPPRRPSRGLLILGAAAFGSLIAFLSYLALRG